MFPDQSLSGLSSCPPARQVAASKSWPQMLGFKKLPFFLHMSSRSFPGLPGPTGAHTGSGRNSSGYQLLKPLHTVTLNMRHMPNPQSSQKERFAMSHTVQGEPKASAAKSYIGSPPHPNRCRHCSHGVKRFLGPCTCLHSGWWKHLPRPDVV